VKRQKLIESFHYQDMALNRVWNLERETMPRLEISKDNPDSTGQYAAEGVPQVTVYGTNSLPDPATQRFIVDYFVGHNPRPHVDERIAKS
jgi:hypothetical protein